MEEGPGDSTDPSHEPVPQPVFKAPRMVSRPKPPVQQEEEMGAEIRLGDFDDVHALSVSEARAVVTAVHEARKKKDPENNPLRDRVYNDQQCAASTLHFPTSADPAPQDHHPVSRLSRQLLTIQGRREPPLHRRPLRHPPGAVHR